MVAMIWRNAPAQARRLMSNPPAEVLALADALRSRQTRAAAILDGKHRSGPPDRRTAAAYTILPAPSPGLHRATACRETAELNRHKEFQNGRR
jgi:hypothetical protein